MMARCRDVFVTGPGMAPYVTDIHPVAGELVEVRLKRLPGDLGAADVGIRLDLERGVRDPVPVG